MTVALAHRPDGRRLDAVGVAWLGAGLTEHLGLDDVDRVWPTVWSDGSDTCRMRRTSEAVVHGPAICLPDGAAHHVARVVARRD